MYKKQIKHTDKYLLSENYNYCYNNIHIFN